MTNEESAAAVLRVLDEFEQLVENSPRLPLSSKTFIDEESFFSLVQRLKTTLDRRPAGILEIVDEFERFVEKGAAVPLSNRRIIDQGEFFTLTHRLKTALRDEFAAGA